MKLHLITIVLDGLPFISWHYPVLRTLSLDWHWWVVEGTAKPVNDTRWVRELIPRLSKDGTNELLRSLCTFDHRITHISAPAWEGKATMFNAALDHIPDPEFLLWQVDSDEIWTRSQIETGFNILQMDPRKNCAFFRCRYFVGPDRIITSREGFGNRTKHEWKRLWKVQQGARFETHEPPVLRGFKEIPWPQSTTELLGLTFDHYAYATKEQMEFKQFYYSSRNNRAGDQYREAVNGWTRLQTAPLPILDLSQYLPWVGRGVTVGPLDKSHSKP